MDGSIAGIQDFQVNILKERVSNCVAYVEIAFSTKLVDRCEMATIKGQEVKSLKEGEVFVFKKLHEGGYGLILSREREALSNVRRLEGETYISRILDIMEADPLYL